MDRMRVTLTACAAVAVLLTLGCRGEREQLPTPETAGAAHLERAKSYVDRGELDKAMDDILVAVELMPDSTAPLLAAAGIYEAKGEFERAVDSYQAALALDPTIARAHFQIGLISKRARKDYDTALARFRRAVELDSTQAEYNYQLADTYHDLERFAESKKYFEKTLSLDPNHAYAHYGLGEILETHMEHLEEGFSEYEKAVSISPRDPTLRLLVGEGYARHKRAEAAERHLREFLRLAPNSPKAETVREIVRQIDISRGVSR